LQLSDKQEAEAEASYKKAVSLAPKSVPAWMALGDFYRGERRWSEAEAAYRKAIELEPNSPQPRVSLAQLFLAQGQEGKAEQVVREAKTALGSTSEGYRMLGDFYFNLGETDKALAEYASLYQEHPKDQRVEDNYAQLLILRDRIDEASKINEQTLEDNPNDSAALINQAQILGRQGRSNDAIPVLQKVLKDEPQNATAHYYLGVAYSQVGNAGQAEGEWREAVRLHPNMTIAQEALANLAKRTGDYAQLAEAAEQIIAAQPSSPQGYILRASARLGQENQTGAEADLRKAIELAAQSPIGYTQLGGLRAAQHRYPEAERLFENALKLDPNYSDALKGLIGVYQQEKQPAEKGLARVNEQISKAPKNSDYYFLQGVLLYQTKDAEKAQSALEKAVDLDSNNESAILLLGQVLMARGLPDEAISEYQTAIQHNPRDVRTYVLLAVIQTGRGNWQEAEDLYQKALAVQPDYGLAANNLASLMLEHGGNVDVALSLAQIGRRGMPDSPMSADTLGWAYYQKGTYGLAIEQLEGAVKKQPNNATYHYHLGMAYEKSGKLAPAKKEMAEVLKLDPNYSQADEAKKILAETAKTN
jgi:tetratricopeptide (TPR) repeat protein